MALEGEGFQGDMASVPPVVVERANLLQDVATMEPIRMSQGAEAPTPVFDLHEEVYADNVVGYMEQRILNLRFQSGRDLDQFTGTDPDFGDEMDRKRFYREKQSYDDWKRYQHAYEHGIPGLLRDQLQANAWAREAEVERVEYELTLAYSDDAAYEAHLQELQHITNAMSEATTEGQRITLELRKGELLAQMEKTQRGERLKKLQSAQKNLDAMNRYLGQLPPAPEGNDED